jgi:hypothetical protein
MDWKEYYLQIVGSAVLVASPFMLFKFYKNFNKIKQVKNQSEDLN